MRANSKRIVLAVAVLVALVVPAAVSAHIERASYWPKPAADRSVQPPAGGKIPKIRSLRSALNPRLAGETRVVSKPYSMKRLRRSIARARRNGVSIRPTVTKPLGARRARALLRINRRLARMCAYRHIQPAINASRNNDRVVVMPGIYTEPRSRRAPTDDPRCERYEITNDRKQTGAVSYKYQVHCPNDQNLIAVIGRRPGRQDPPQPPAWERYNIPDNGPCIRCNLQLEGSGVGPDDVVVDAGRVASGNGGPAHPVKDVTIRADRADGFVLRNMNVRHAREHGIYVLEVDGYVLDRFKVFWNEEYGVLTFTSDHGVMQNCEAAGSGDAGVYPGSAAETGHERRPGTKFRYNQQVRRCDLHHNVLGYSGTNANAVHIHHNNFFDNGVGMVTDVVTGAGHPGYPADSTLVERNRFWDNNFNPYAGDSDVDPLLPVPVGTGLWILGANDTTVRFNRFWANGRRGIMLNGVPDGLVCGPASGAIDGTTDYNEQKGCKPAEVSTSHRNRFHDNIFDIPPGGGVARNGLHVWWDDFPGNMGNCWWRNRTPGNQPLRSSPSPLPDCDQGHTPGESIGRGSVPEHFAEVLGCYGAYEADEYNPAICPWFAGSGR